MIGIRNYIIHPFRRGGVTRVDSMIFLFSHPVPPEENHPLKPKVGKDPKYRNTPGGLQGAYEVLREKLDSYVNTI